MLPFLLSALLALLLATSPASAGFLDKNEGCGDSWIITPSGQLRAGCLDQACYIQPITGIDINRFIINDDGYLRWTDDRFTYGHFLNTCIDCKPIYNGLGELRCRCMGARVKKYRTTSIFLNDRVRNWYGYLWIDGKIETAIPHTWPCKGDDWRPDDFPPLVFPLPADPFPETSKDNREYNRPPAPTLVLEHTTATALPVEPETLIVDTRPSPTAPGN